MTLQEKIQKKAEEFGKLAPVFLEGAKFALENQWINCKEDLPCNHEELIFLGRLIGGSETIEVFVRYESGDIWSDYMIYENGTWRWKDYEPAYWMIPQK